MIDNPQTKAPDEQILQVLEYLSSDTVWYVSSVLHFFKLHCVWSVDVRKLLSLIWLVNKVLNDVIGRLTQLSCGFISFEDSKM